MFCSNCGSPNDGGLRFCAKCGSPLSTAGTRGDPAPAPPPVNIGTMRTSGIQPAGITVSGKNPTLALVLSIFLGSLGGGQFYNGDWKKGLVMAGATLLLGVVTSGLAPFGVWIWSMIDAWQVASGKGRAW